MIDLDTYRADNSEITAMGPVLAAGQHYAINITGTYSYWFDFDWENRGACRGVPEEMPMFPSPGADNGPVGDDAAWSFASPNDLSDCDDPVPDDRSFDVSLDGGNSETEIDPINAGGGPNPGHSYDYLVTGQGEPIVFYVHDAKTEDNYGILKITIQPAESQTEIWADNNCDGAINGEDATRAMLALVKPADVPDIPDCPGIGEELNFIDIHPAGAGTIVWGDVHCGGGLDGRDVLAVLLAMEELARLPVEGFCPEAGDEVVFAGS